MKLVTIIGARPQFVKAAIVSKALANHAHIQEIVIHTGQHFDQNMSDIFFDQLNIKKPDYMLNINGGTHGKMTGEMLAAIEEILIKEKPDYVMVYGDTNSTLAGALAAAKLHIPVAHLEAGLRSYNRAMPEEINRILTDQVSDILFCPTDTAIQNLEQEGFNNPNNHAQIVKNGDVMFDIAKVMEPHAQKPDALPYADNFILVTCHRQENTDDRETLANIITALNTIHETIAPVVFPIHPRTRKMIDQFKIDTHFHAIEPVGYLEMLWLLKQCDLVMTDSGGLQKEAYFMHKHCVTMREQTEWVELIDHNVNILSGSDSDKIIKAVQTFMIQSFSSDTALYGEGQAADIIAQTLADIKINH